MREAGEPLRAARGVGRVLMTADAVGGVWEYALELCRGLGRHRVAVTLVVMGPPPDVTQERAARQLDNVRLVVGPFKLEWMDDPWVDLELAGAWLLELEARETPDVVHLNGYVAGALPFLAPKVVVGHSCVLSWWQAVKGEPAPPSWQRYHQLVSAGVQAAHRVVAPSAGMLAALERFYGPLPTAEVIFNGREAADYAPGIKAPYVLAAGRLWDEAKNVAQLASVADRVRWPIRVAGNAAGTNDRLGTTDRALARVDLLGRLSARELAERFAEASIYALPARYEPFGLTVLEAALSGCALVLGDIPTLRELWDGAASFVTPGDDDALVATLATLIERPDELKRHAHAARQRARRFDADTMTARYLALYHAVVDAASPRPPSSSLLDPCVAAAAPMPEVSCGS